MTSAGVIRLFLALLLSGLMGWSVLQNNDRDAGAEDGLRYPAPAPGSFLPVMLLILLLQASIFYGVTRSLTLILSNFFGIFLQICFYDMLLLLFLPKLRTILNARACATLWMLPNILYITAMKGMSPEQPIWVIDIPSGVIRILTIVWAVGFCAVLLWKLLEHLIFRSRILRPAVSVEDEAILQIMHQEHLDTGNAHRDYPVLISPAVRTPLSIGLFSRTIRIVLPQTDYTPEQLHLIFRHELIHICRKDSCSKLFLLFCTAVCWFNPFMWISMRKSFDDLELSCDESVLLDSDPAQRQQYAELLLKTAGQEQGFTTCLSASAAALRYRLKNTVHPQKRHSGVLTICILSLVLLLTSGSVAVAYETVSDPDTIFCGQSAKDCSLRYIRPGDTSARICLDEEGLMQYLTELPLQKLTGNYTFSEDPSMTALFDTPAGVLGIHLREHLLTLTPFWKELDKQGNQESYYLPQGIDWALMDTLLAPVPSMTVCLNGSSNGKFGTGPVSLIQRSGDTSCLLIDNSYARLDLTDNNLDYDSLSLEFSQSPLSDVTLTVTDQQGEHPEVSTLDATQHIEIPLSTFSRHYHVSCSFQGPDGSIWDVVFEFDLSRP